MRNLSANNALKLARELMDQHGLRGWNLRLGNGQRTIGRCNHTIRSITLSKHLIRWNGRDVVTDIILHEIAHALTVRPGHGERWKAICTRIGAKPQRIATHVVIPIYYCDDCLTQYGLSRTPKVCGSCGGTTLIPAITP
jgi:predicted SprT family Zn-dependent metalloprotease